MASERQSKELAEGMTEAGKGQVPRPGQVKDRSKHGSSDPRGSDRLAQGMDEASERQTGSKGGQSGA